MKKLALSAAVASLALSACVSAAKINNNNGWNPWGNNNNQNGNSGNTNGSDAGPGSSVRLVGTVWGPGKAFPVQGALIAANQSPPAAIPTEIFCEACQPVSGLHTLSGDDGYFELTVMAGSTFHLTVQKGQFRRVREFTVPSGNPTYNLPEELTTLLSRTDAVSGDTIPRMAIAAGSYDDMETIFGKVGIGEVNADNTFDCSSATGIFDIYSNGGDCGSFAVGTFDELVSNPSLLRQYHIIFVPCSSSSSTVTNEVVHSNIRDYVWGGGKWYVADWSYDWVEQVWPEFLHFTASGGGECESASVGSCNHGPSFDSNGHAVNDNLRNWLNAIGVSDTQLFLKENWDTIGSLGSGYVGVDPELGDVYKTPDVWVEGPWTEGVSWQTGPNYPLTVTWPYNCGRALYTTYHTVGEMSGPHPGLEPQEKILFYLVMEIGVCQTGPIVE
jgi:hypothetical protein